MSSRPLVTIQGKTKKNEKKSASLPLPDVFNTPLRVDLIRFVHSNLSKNHRQPYAVSFLAGMQHSAESWGTGRAVSRIPRVSGGGTHRAGQGAFGNMCRKGRMFAPTKIYRRWHRKVNGKQKRYAVCAALAATAVPALVMARGHKISNIPEIPLVIADSAFNNLNNKSKAALALLEQYKVSDDVNASKNTRRFRPGKGKARGRRYIAKKGPLVVYHEEGSGLIKAFRNLPGVDVRNVVNLDVMTLAPGGHVGRFIVWTEKAFRALNTLFGTLKFEAKNKPGWKIPRASLFNPDIDRIIHAIEHKGALKPRRPDNSRHSPKRNPYTNFRYMMKLNPYAETTKRRTLVAALKLKETKEKLKVQKEKAKTQPKKMTKKQRAYRKKVAKKNKLAGKKLAKANQTYRRLLRAPAKAPAKDASEVQPQF